MIKLIVSDMDGTLLSDEKKMDPQLFGLLPKLKERGIRFVVASGRQYPSLRYDFQEHIADVVVIAENGAFVVDHETELMTAHMTKEQVKHCLEVITAQEGIEPLVCTKYFGYTANKDVYDFLSSDRFHYAIRLVENLYEIEDEILKVSLVTEAPQGAEDCYARLRPLLGADINLVISGGNCLDTGIFGVNKGTAVKALQEKWGILPEETMVFGDQQNDLEMFAQAGFSFAMAEATPRVKAYARFQAGSNNEGGVCKKIREMLEIE